MASITYEKLKIDLADNESVLDGLLRSGCKVASSCRSGICQSCIMRVVEGVVPAESQKGLKDTLRAANYFLPCVCRPKEDLTIAAADAGLCLRAKIERIEKMAADVARVILSCEQRLEYRAGQFVNVVRADGLSRSYSIASLPCRDEHLELHVRKVAGGRMSTWLHEEAVSGEELELRGPCGDCFYLPGKSDQPILLAGTGTGLAPLYGIVQDALRSGHAGPITLYHGALVETGLYLVEELFELTAAHSNFRYVPCVLRGEDVAKGVRVGPLDQIIFGEFPKLAGFRVYLCGSPDIVNALRKKAFLSGARMNEIHSDPFIIAKAG